MDGSSFISEMIEVTGSWFATVGNELFISAAAGACPPEVEGVVPLLKQFGLTSEMAKRAKGPVLVHSIGTFILGFRGLNNLS